jgi:hypothetical protein
MCSHCSHINKASDTKCQGNIIIYLLDCKKLNKKEENNETRALSKNPSTPMLEKKSSRAVLSNNYLSEPKTDSIKRTNCMCYTNYDDIYIKNGVCRFCNRNVDTPTYDQTLKRKYGDQLRPRYYCKLKPSVPNKSAVKVEVKTDREYRPTIHETIKKKEEKLFRSPSTSKVKVVTTNRYTIEHDDENTHSPNPFNPRKIPDGKDKSQTRLNSTQKKGKVEMTINTNTMKYKK